MRIPVNLSSEPFRRDRPILVASAATGVLLLMLFALLVVLNVSERGRAAELRRTIGSLERQVAVLARQQSQVEAVLHRPENAAVLERSQFLNALLFRKGISWTRTFDDLEKVMPHNVRLITVRPQVNGANEIVLDMVVASEAPDGVPVVEFLRNLESSPQFGAISIQNRIPPSQSEPLLRYRISVNYAQKL